VRIGGPHPVHARSDRRLARADDLGEAPEQGLGLRRQAVEIHAQRLTAGTAAEILVATLSQ
jgi:hypothetical protein